MRGIVSIYLKVGYNFNQKNLFRINCTGEGEAFGGITKAMMGCFHVRIAKQDEDCALKQNFVSLAFLKINWS